MTKQALIIDASETMATLMRSSGSYVYSRLTNAASKRAYKLCMTECIRHVSSGLESIEFIKARIEGIRLDIVYRYPKSFFNNRSDELYGCKIAIEQAIEIVEYIEAKFVTGSHDPIPRIYKDAGVTYFEDEDLFKI